MSAVEPAADRPAPEPISPLKEAWIVYRRNTPAVFGTLLLLVIVAFVVYGTFIYKGDPYEIIWAPQTPPGSEATVPLGTDNLGRDIMRGLLKGGGPTLAVGAAAAIITLVIGIFLGGIAGYFGGWIDDLLMRITEFFQVLPALLFAMVVITLFSPSTITTAIAIGVVLWPQTARLTRAEFLKIRELEYVTAARSIGARNGRIMWKVILPNALPPLIVSATLTVGVAILFQAGLVLPRPRRSQHHVVGADDRHEPAIHPRRLVAGHPSRRRDLPDGARGQPGRRRTERRLQSQAARALT